ncbi:restriction endonuclease subunit S [uncultured Brachyspira sp.]|uniref:restriction endonuclease subunit S n=1 Tax=uncultured Brachyspira sp. TaxID=221953 RepID=UPI002587468D|nr:restriction endonuclease subunit S [uncultured Brachyspira sp.]
MSKLEELLNKECPDGVEYVELSSVINYEQPSKYIVENTKYNDDYDTPVLTAGQTFILGYTNEKDGIYKASKKEPVIIFDDFTTSFHWVDFNFKVKSSAMKMLKVIDENKSNFRYLYYCMKNIKYVPLDHTRQWIEKYSKFMIPLPPIKVQKEIVRILDTFTKYQDLLNRELELRKKQYEYYRDKLLTFGDEVEYRTVGDVGLVTKLAGFEFTKYVTYSNKGKIIALRGLNVKNGRLNLDEVKYIDESDLTKLTRSKLYIDDMLFTYVGTIGEVALIDENDKYYLAPNVALIRFDKKIILPKFMRYYFQSNIFFNTQINKLLQSSSMKNIPMEKIRKFLVPVPPLEEQERIVNILDKFDALCNDITKGLPAEIELRKKQYEYYRDKLLTFKEKKK